MRVSRRSVLTGVFGGGIAGRAIMPGGREPSRATASALALKDLDSAAAAPVLKLDGLKSPVIIESIKLLKEEAMSRRCRSTRELLFRPNPARTWLPSMMPSIASPRWIQERQRWWRRASSGV